MEQLWQKANVRQAIRRIVELGAGDGSFLLKVARRWGPPVERMTVVLVDRQNLVKTTVRREFARFGWDVECVTADVFDWLSEARMEPGTGTIANLFLHHFDEDELRTLFHRASSMSNFFAACEPRRASLALNASRLLGVIGCNSVSRHDATVSVRAGFRGRELSALWPEQNGWLLDEHEAGLFSHCFLARRRTALEDFNEPDA
jgi:hypothetical protein